MAVPPNFGCWISVLVLVRPLKADSKIARADSADESVETPRISGRSFAANADLRCLRLDVVGQGSCGQRRRADGKNCNQSVAKHEPPANTKDQVKRKDYDNFRTAMSIRSRRIHAPGRFPALWVIGRLFPAICRKRSRSSAPKSRQFASETARNVEGICTNSLHPSLEISALGLRARELVEQGPIAREKASHEAFRFEVLE